MNRTSRNALQKVVNPSKALSKKAFFYKNMDFLGHVPPKVQPAPEERQDFLELM